MKKIFSEGTLWAMFALTHVIVLACPNELSATIGVNWWALSSSPGFYFP